VGSLRVLRLAPGPPGALARSSRSWDRPETDEATLLVAVPAHEAIVLGAFQRGSELPTTELPVERRGSGGAAVRVGPGTVWIQLALPRPEALVPCTPDKLLNRYVRPLLRALTRVSSVPASYFGRDWISAAHRPVALVAFAHEASSGRCLFEAVVAVEAPFALASRASFLGKRPATLAEVAGRALDPVAVAAAIADAYVALASESRELDVAASTPAEPENDGAIPLGLLEPAWTATRDEAMGTIAAGLDANGRLRLGGELMASRDAVLLLEDRVATLSADASEEDIGRTVDEALTMNGAVVFGVRSLTSIRDVIVEARRARAGGSAH
jgi:hypothetical protein